MNKFLKLYSVYDKSDAPKMAAERFSCAENEIFTSVLKEGRDADDEKGEAALDWLIFTAYTGEGGAGPAQTDADFNLFYEDDGVYLEVYPAIGGGRPLEAEEAFEYIKRKALGSADVAAAQNLIQNGDGGRVKIAPAQDETVLSEDIKAWYSSDEMEGYMSFLPPDEAGIKLSVTQISEKLKLAGIVYGVSPLSLGEANREKKYGKQYTVARGTLPEDGANGVLTYHFEKNNEGGRPKEDEKGNVDYRDLSLFERVRKGQLLITRTLATQGKPGYTVTGRELEPRAGKEASMPRTKNIVINEEQTAAHAEVSGMVEIINGVICVSNTYTVKGDCDLSTGNIDFYGNVEIGGAVISGMLVKASGNITVGGVVNEAELIAGGNIELKLGIQGNNKGSITAAGSVTAAFIERADVHAKGDITSDVIMHSNIETGRQLLVRGKRGNIVGGKALVGEVVVAKTIGALSHVQTEIEVGLPPEKKARIKVLKEELEKLAKENAKIKQIELYLSKAENLSEDKKNALTESVAQTRTQTDKETAAFSKELSALQYEAEHAIDGKVHCSVEVYPGTKITIGTGIYRIEEQTRAATFKYDKGEVVFGPCERSE